MTFGSFDVREDDEYNDIGFMEISKIFKISNTFYVETGQFDLIYRNKPYYHMQIMEPPLIIITTKI